MTTSFRVHALAAIASAFLLAACGGGGTGGAAAPQSVTITESNAKPVAADALDAVQYTFASSGATGPLGVQVDSGADTTLTVIECSADGTLTVNGYNANGTLSGIECSPNGLIVSGDISVPTGGGLVLTNNSTVAGSADGAVTLSGYNANGSLIVSGGITVPTGGGLVLPAGSASISINASMTPTLASGSLQISDASSLAVQATSHQISPLATMNNPSLDTGGELRLAWTVTSSAPQTLVATGTSMLSIRTISGVTRTVTPRDFSESLTVSGSTYTGSLTAAIETDSSRLGSGTVSYTISTPTPVVWNASTRTVSAGVIKVVGANNSELLVTIAAGGAVTIQLDANGDGVYEKTITSTTTELAGVL